MIQYRNLEMDEIDRELFRDFIRRQAVNKCWRREAGAWVIKDAPFIDDWSEDDYRILTDCLKQTILEGGFVAGAFSEGRLKGFVAVTAGLFGGENKYLDLASLHVSEDIRGHGIGRTLFSPPKTGPEKAARRSSIFPPTPPLKVRLFIKPWAAWRPPGTTRDMWRRSLMTVSWNA